MILHPWHEIASGEQVPEILNAIIEIPRGSVAKYEIDKASGLIKLDRVMFSAVHYPINYGFIPQTLGDDGDPLDILVLSQVATVPLCLVRCKVIGLMQMIDSGKLDDKIIAVALNDASVSHIEHIDDIPLHYKMELKNFFEDYKKLENKTVVVDEFQGRDAAFASIQHSIDLYRQQFGK